MSHVMSHLYPVRLEYSCMRVLQRVLGVLLRVLHVLQRVLRVLQCVSSHVTRHVTLVPHPS